MGLLTFDYIFTSINLVVCLFVASLTLRYYKINNNKKLLPLLCGFFLLAIGYGIKIVANSKGIAGLTGAFNALILIGTYVIITTYYKTSWRVHLPVAGFSIATAILSISDVVLAHVIMGNFILFLVAILEQEVKHHEKKSQAKMLIASFTVIGLGKGIALLALINLPLVVVSWGGVSLGYLLLLGTLLKAKNEAKKK